MSYGLAIDPGLSTGIVLWQWSDRAPYNRERVWQVGGGVEGLSLWLEEARVRFSSARNAWSFNGAPLKALVVEKFTPTGGAGHALTEASVEPLRCEGALIALGSRDKIIWQRPAAQYFVGGMTPADRKKNSRAWLKEHGLHLTGRDVKMPDADDAISATLHSIAYMRGIRHMPTLKHFFGERA